MTTLVWLIMALPFIYFGKKLFGIDIMTGKGCVLMGISLILSGIIMAATGFSEEIKKCPKCKSRRLKFDLEKRYYVCKKCQHKFLADGKALNIDTYA